MLQAQEELQLERASNRQLMENFSAQKGMANAELVRLQVSIRQHSSAYVSIRQHTSAYVSIRQHTSAYNAELVRLQVQRHSASRTYADVC